MSSDLEKAEELQGLMIDIATTSHRFEERYQELRSYFVSKNTTSNFPSIVKRNRTVNQFWSFISSKYDNYKERREFIYGEFNDFLCHLESNSGSPLESLVSDELTINADFIHDEWNRALKRKVDDPEGSITLARTLLESTLKYILDDLNVDYDKNSEFSDLYKKVSTELNLAPNEHTEQIFKQILGGCSGIVNGLAALRNKHGDSHGGKKVRPLERHAELAVNLSGTMSMFIFKTFHKK